MKKITFTFFAFLFVTHFSWSQSNAEHGAAAIGLIVSDVEASQEFYKDVLGFVELFEFSLDEAWSDEAGAANGKPFSVKVLKQKNLPTATTLKLAYFEKTKKQPDLSGIDVQSGVNYVTFRYNLEEFNGIVKKVQDAGIKMTGWVKRDNYQLFFIKDPDGIFVEIIGPPEK